MHTLRTILSWTRSRSPSRSRTNRPRLRQILALWVTTFGFAPASQAVVFDLEIEEIYTDATLATPAAGFIVTPAGVLAGPLAPGQVIELSLSVENATADVVSELFTTLVIDGSDLIFLGSSIPASEILIDGPDSLALVSSPSVKANSPNPNGMAGEIWVQATAYESAGAGTAGTGPDDDFSRLYLELSEDFQAVPDASLHFQLTSTALDTPFFPPGGPLISSRPVRVYIPNPVVDRDSDGVPDFLDNCESTANGPGDPSNQVDIDGDGNGDVCDCDFTGDNYIFGDDFNLLFAGFNTADPNLDTTGDGFVFGDDVKNCLRRQAQPAGD